jgi:hypothetical protein
METINNSYGRYQEGSFLYQNELLPITSRSCADQFEAVSILRKRGVKKTILPQQV